MLYDARTKIQDPRHNFVFGAMSFQAATNRLLKGNTIYKKSIRKLNS